MYNLPFLRYIYTTTEFKKYDCVTLPICGKVFKYYKSCLQANKNMINAGSFFFFSAGCLHVVFFNADLHYPKQSLTDFLILLV